MGTAHTMLWRRESPGQRLGGSQEGATCVRDAQLDQSWRVASGCWR